MTSAPPRNPAPADYSGPANATRAQSRIFSAFAALVQSTRYDEIRVSDLIDAADVGRSTFYDHFRDKDDVLRQSVKAPLAPMADAAIGIGDAERLTLTMRHFWERRALARVILSQPTRDVVAAALFELITESAAGNESARSTLEVIATTRAHGLIAFLAGWVAGRPALSPEDAARAVLAACPPTDFVGGRSPR